VTLSGTFTNFTADISHSDELGGQVTSLINATNVHTHLAIKDVQVDLPGRDGVTDFLGGDLTVYESGGADTAVSDVSAGCALTPVAAGTYTLTLASGLTNGFVYATRESPYASDAMVLKTAVRSDGKVMNAKNVWLSKKRIGTTGDWQYSLSLFDTGGANHAYTLTFDAATNVNRAPVFQNMPDKTVKAGETLRFLAVASDDGGAPRLSAAALPAGASFTPGESAGKLARGVFAWTPGAAQGGTYPVRFTAADGELSSSATVRVTVGGGTAEPPAGGEPGWWRGRGVLNAAARTNDYAALNGGQLRHLAHMAWNELNALPGGAGFPPAFTNAGNNYAAVNVGQLKETARPFYDRMGLAYPWTEETGENHALANVGQAKHLFSFDPHRDSDADGMPDWWEDLHGLNRTDPSDADRDEDGDGVPNLQEFLDGTDPLSP
jgi:hypothetical protein